MASGSGTKTETDPVQEVLNSLAAENLEGKFLGEVDERIATLTPLKEEHDRLVALRQRLQGSVNGRRGTGGPRGPRQDRKGEFLAAVRAHPGSTVGELAETMDGVQASYLYRVRDKALASGEIRQDDGKIFIASS